MKCTSLDNFHFKHILSFFPNSLRTTFLQNAYFSCVFISIRVQNPSLLLLPFPSVLPSSSVNHKIYVLPDNYIKEKLFLPSCIQKPMPYAIVKVLRC